MTSQQLIGSLHRQAKEDFKTARILFREKRYSFSLFIGQLVLEKLLKILVIKKTNKLYPPIHDLKKLAGLSKIKLSPSQAADLDEITSFNIAARYDTEKFEFYKKANAAFTKTWFTKIKHYKTWLENQF